MVYLLLSGHSYRYQIEHTVHIFYTQNSLKVLEKEPTELATDDSLVVSSLEEHTDHCKVSALLKTTQGLREKTRELPLQASESEKKLELTRLIYLLLCEETGQKKAWGMLVGVRPVSLLRSLALKHGTTAALELLKETYLVQPEKIELAQRIMENQRVILENNLENAYSLYVNIPFCPSRCSYCSFVTHAVENANALLDDYLSLLVQEIEATVAIAEKSGRILQTIYIGGGTPTVLSLEQLALLLDTIAKVTRPQRHNLLEYTVEAGRPDTITIEKLRLLKKYGVGRISVNPQTMNDRVLSNIGRNHSTAQTLEAVAWAREIGFSVINMDFIAGLPGESAESFALGLAQATALRPENLTVHTLTLKRSAYLRDQQGVFEENKNMLEQLSTASEELEKAGYAPYYLYRQKGALSTLENIGYTLGKSASLYNIYSMEEAQTILAVGAGGVTKLRKTSGQQPELLRCFNPKYPYEYIARFAEVMAKKDEITKFFRPL